MSLVMVKKTSLWYDNYYPFDPFVKTFGERIIYDSILNRKANIKDIIEEGNSSWPMTNTWEFMDPSLLVYIRLRISLEGGNWLLFGTWFSELDQTSRTMNWWFRRLIYKKKNLFMEVFELDWWFIADSRFLTIHLLFDLYKLKLKKKIPKYICSIVPLP